MQCPKWLFSVLPRLHVFLVCCSRIFWITFLPSFFSASISLHGSPKTVKHNRPRKTPMRKLHINRVSILSVYPEKKRSSNPAFSGFPNISFCTHFQKHLSCNIRCSPAVTLNRLTPNDPYMGRIAPLTSKRCILYIYSTNVGTEYFKHALYSPFFLFKMQFVS